VKTAKKAASTKQGFLSHLFGIFAPTQQPAREVKSSVDMGQHKLFEAKPVFGVQIVQGVSPDW
jgi:hypothetical protein